MAKIPWLAFRNSIGTEHFDVQPEIWVVHAILFAENSLLQLQNGVCCLRKIFLHWLRKLRTIDPMYYHEIETLRDPGACHFRRCVSEAAELLTLCQFMILGILHKVSSNKNVCWYADWRSLRCVIGSLLGSDAAAFLQWPPKACWSHGLMLCDEWQPVLRRVCTAALCWVMSQTALGRFSS